MGGYIIKIAPLKTVIIMDVLQCPDKTPAEHTASGQ